MFFGLEVKSNQNSAKPLKLENPLRISQAVLEPSKNGKKEPVSVLVEYEKRPFIICVLDSSTTWQSPLDLMFDRGTSLKFYLRGQGTVHLTGYQIKDEEDLDISMSEIESSEYDEEEEVAKQLAFGSASKVRRSGNAEKVAKTNGVNGSPDKKRRKTENVVVNQADDDDDDESDDEDYQFVDSSGNDDDDDDDDDENDDEDDSDDGMSDEDLDDEEGEDTD